MILVVYILHGIELEISEAVHTHSLRSTTLRPEFSESDRHKNAKALYTSFQPRWQTNIIRLWPGTPIDPLVYDLFVADLVMFYGVGISALSNIVPFDALSYAWGPPVFNDILICSGFEYPITEHLANALRNLKATYVVRLLWVDALCINQYNLEEKAEQVRVMLSIFQKASRVVIRLGDSSLEQQSVFAEVTKRSGAA
jgi:Heterokaryon incompatibility protein (HET)